tara:strand:- start:769 stop:1839 length:1071 start_codon:yes stop_codon:yes gene_type:complete
MPIKCKEPKFEEICDPKHINEKYREMTKYPTRFKGKWKEACRKKSHRFSERHWIKPDDYSIEQWNMVKTKKKGKIIKDRWVDSINKFRKCNASKNYDSNKKINLKKNLITKIKQQQEDRKIIKKKLTVLEKKIRNMKNKKKNKDEMKKILDEVKNTNTMEMIKKKSYVPKYILPPPPLPMALSPDMLSNNDMIHPNIPSKQFRPLPPKNRRIKPKKLTSQKTKKPKKPTPRKTKKRKDSLFLDIKNQNQNLSPETIKIWGKLIDSPMTPKKNFFPSRRLTDSPEWYIDKSKINFDDPLYTRLREAVAKGTRKQRKRRNNSTQKAKKKKTQKAKKKKTQKAKKKNKKNKKKSKKSKK